MLAVSVTFGSVPFYIIILSLFAMRFGMYDTFDQNAILSVQLSQSCRLCVVRSRSTFVATLVRYRDRIHRVNPQLSTYASAH